MKMHKLLQKSLILGVVLATSAIVPHTAQAEVPINSDFVQSKNQNPTKEFTFNFTNTFDYGACLDVILLAYEQRNNELANVPKNDCAARVLETFGNNISQDVALELVKSANLHATEGLENPLYPSLGLRRRIAINLGYVYEADQNNPSILKFVDPEVN